MSYPPSLVVHLERPFADFREPGVPSRQVILMGLQWPTKEYWPTWAIDWIEQGAPIDFEIVDILEKAMANKNFPQTFRHRAAKIVKRWSNEEST